MNPTETPKKKDTVRISKKDLLKLLSDNEQQAAQIQRLQERCNEYMEEVRSLKKDLEEAEKSLDAAEEAMIEEEIAKIPEENPITKVIEELKKNPPARPENPMPRHPMGRGIYIDGASRYR